MYITVEEKGSSVYVRRELFAEGQGEVGMRSDYRMLVDSLNACTQNDCTSCLFCGYSTGHEHCTDMLRSIAAREIEKLAKL